LSGLIVKMQANAKPPPRKPRYRLYIDESGDHTYKQVNTVAHQYLALLGVWFELGDDYTEFASDLERFKQRLFGQRPDNPVILHRSDIINRKGAFGILRDAEIRERFDSGLLEVIRRARFKMVVVVLDKQRHLMQYNNPFHPYHYCMAAMLERYSGWLNYKNTVGDVMAESRGKEEDLQLKQAYRRVYESGTMHYSHQKHQRALTSREIKIRSRARTSLGCNWRMCWRILLNRRYWHRTDRSPIPATCLERGFMKSLRRSLTATKAPVR